MYSEDDINSAVAAGALSADAAESFRSHMSKVRELPWGSEENFRLINSFNDIFVAIGIVILLIAVGAIGQAIGSVIVPIETWSELTQRDASAAEYEAWRNARNVSDALEVSLASLFVAAAAWSLAEFFTRKRRMALPSILLLLAFVGGVFVGIAGSSIVIAENGNDILGAVLITAAGLFAAGSAYLHWRRFQVPITVAAAAGVAVISLIMAILIIAQIEPDTPPFLIALFVAGLSVFAFAMRWDISDRERVTRRSDVAFWLHLLAAPLIAHPIFALIGVTDGNNIGILAAVSVLVVYCAFGLLALAIDRRALLVSALAYVLFALTFLFRQFGAVELNFALTALVIGSALLSLSAFWQPIRRAVVSAMPEKIRELVPATTDEPVALASTATA